MDSLFHKFIPSTRIFVSSCRLFIRLRSIQPLLDLRIRLLNTITEAYLCFQVQRLDGRLAQYYLLGSPSGPKTLYVKLLQATVEMSARLHLASAELKSTSLVCRLRA